MGRLKLIAWALLLAYPPAMVLGVSRVPYPLALAAALFSLPLVLVALYIVVSYLSVGARGSLKFLAASSLISYAFEFTGVHYGLPFGKYYYSPMGLGPLAGGVPLMIPLLWAALGFLSLEALGLPAAVLGMVSMDLSFDPILSSRARLWTWVTRGPYYGVPLLNFVGWAVVSSAFYAAYLAMGGPVPARSPRALAFYIEYVGAWCLLDVVKGLGLAAYVGASATAVTLAISYAIKTAGPWARKGASG